MFYQRRSTVPPSEALVVYQNPGFWRKLTFRSEEISEGFKELFVSVPQGLASLVVNVLRGLFRPATLIRVGADLLALSCVSLCLACFCALKEGGIDLYMSSFLPFLGVLSVFVIFTESLRSSRIFLFIVSLLILTGTALQTLLKLPAPASVQPSNTGLVFYAVVSVAFGFLALPVFNALICARNRDLSIKLLNVVIFLLYAALLVFGRRVNGTRAWIYLGSISFQLTEVTKFLTLILFAMEFTNGADTPEKRLRRGVFTFLMNAAFLLIVNEFGALCVILAGFVLTAFFYIPSVWRVFRALLLLAALLTSMILGCFACYRLREVSHERNPDANINPAVEQGAKIYAKFKLRADIVLHPESVDKNNGGYQSARAKNAVLLSSWLGSSYEVYIPVVESDYIFDYLLLRMGVLFGILVLLLMLLLFLNAALSCLKNPRSTEGAAGVALAFSISFQSVLAAASAMGQFLTVGVPFAFLAHGGSSTLVNYAMVMYILYAMRRVSEADTGNKRRVIRRGRI